MRILFVSRFRGWTLAAPRADTGRILVGYWYVDCDGDGDGSGDGDGDGDGDGHGDGDGDGSGRKIRF